MHPPKRAAAPSGVLGSAAEPLSAFTCELQLLHDIDPVQGERWIQAAAAAHAALVAPSKALQRDPHEAMHSAQASTRTQYPLQ
jgi:hypothetical protein